MEDLYDLNAIWHSAQTDSLPSSAEMLTMVSTFRNQKLRKKWRVIIGSFAIALGMIAVLFCVPFALPSSFVGGGLIALSALVLAVNNIRALKRFNQLEDCTNLEFLAFIEQTRLNQLHYYKRTQGLIMLLCSAGWLLYLFEAVAGHPLWTGVLYGISAVYLLVMWAVVRPWYYKKEAAKLNAMRERLEKIARQLQ